MNIHDYEDLINPRKEQTFDYSVIKIKQLVYDYWDRYRSSVYWFEDELIKLKDNQHILDYDMFGGWDFEIIKVTFTDNTVEEYKFQTY